MIANGGSMKCGGSCENFPLQIGENHMKSHMFSINMGGYEIVLGAEWVRTLGPILMDFKELTMKFDYEGQQYKFQGITSSSPEIISSHRMENLLKKVHSSIISQLHAIQSTETPYVSQDLQSIISKHQVVFSTPQRLPPSHGVHDHSIPLVLGILPPNIRPYHHPFSQKMKLRKLFKNFSTQVLSTLVQDPNILMWSWSLRNKVLGSCVLIYAPSKNSPLNTNDAGPSSSKRKWRTTQCPSVHFEVFLNFKDEMSRNILKIL
jgi:hypothetical protein